MTVNVQCIPTGCNKCNTTIAATVKITISIHNRDYDYYKILILSVLLCITPM